MSKQLVSVDWLYQNITKENLVILDASPERAVSGVTSDWPDLFIPHARRFDIKKNFTNKESEFPNIYTSPRVWWMFKAMGHKNVKVLNGGLPEWIDKGYRTTAYRDLNQEYSIGDFRSHLKSEYVLNYADVMANIKSKEFTIVDARSVGRFNGEDPEPRRHLASGNIPHSVNIPYTRVLDGWKYKSREEISRVFREQVSEDAQLVFSCGSGMTACIIMLAHEIALRGSRYLYDGSWTEYASLSGLRTDE